MTSLIQKAGEVRLATMTVYPANGGVPIEAEPKLVWPGQCVEAVGYGNSETGAVQSVELRVMDVE